MHLVYNEFMKLDKKFYSQDVLKAAPKLLGKVLVRKLEDGTEIRKIITEVEAYRGEEDLANHANKGRTKRTEVMYWEAGHVYVYLIYGMYWLLNIVTGQKDDPQAVLIRSLEGVKGPGRVGKMLKLNKSLYGEDLSKSKRLWIEDAGIKSGKIKKAPRIGIGYASEWTQKPWRFLTEA